MQTSLRPPEDDDMFMFGKKFAHKVEFEDWLPLRDKITDWLAERAERRYSVKFGATRLTFRGSTFGTKTSQPATFAFKSASDAIEFKMMIGA